MCTRQQVKNHYQSNRDYYLGKAKLRNSIQRLRFREFIWNYLEKHPCIDCGENDPVVLEFDHIHSKFMNGSHMIHQADIDIVKNEIGKCEVRCANCHRRKTALEFNWFRK